jgi:predicted PurR-regulated permease PerM
MSQDVPTGAPPRPPRVTVEIAGRTLAVLLAAFALAWVGSRLGNFAMIVVFAVLLATAIDQPVSALQRRGVPRPLGIGLHYLALLAVLALVVVVLIPLVAAEATLLRLEIPAYLAELEARLAAINPEAGADLSLARIAQEGSGSVGSLAGRLTAVTLDAVRTLLYVFITLVLAFFLAAEPGIVGKLVARFAPVRHQARVLAVARRSRDRIGAWARGQVLIAVIFGLAMGIGLRVIGVPYAVSLGTAAGVLEIFPYVGGAVTVILAAITALSVGVPQVIAVLVLYVVLVNLESHVLSPLLFGKAVGLPPVAILVALLAGVELLGVLGALLAIPVAVIIWVVVDEVWPAPAAAVETPARSAPVAAPAAVEAD